MLSGVIIVAFLAPLVILTSVITISEIMRDKRE